MSHEVNSDAGVIQRGFARLGTKHPSKIRPVPLLEMRTAAVGLIQRDFSQARVDRIVAELDLDAIGILTVNYRDGVYHIIDGQHRQKALIQYFAPKDPGVVDCRVFEGLSDAEMAHIFLLTTHVLGVKPFTRFQIACTAGEEIETDVRRSVEAQGLKLDLRKQRRCVACVSTLRRIYNSYGREVLERVLRVARDAFDGDAAAFDGDFLFGLARFLDRYFQDPRLDLPVLVERLAGVTMGMRAIVQRAESQRDRTGSSKSNCLAATLVDLYNDGQDRNARLVQWWKAVES